MTLNVRAFALAAGTAAAILFSLCAAAVAFDPRSSTAFFSFITHLDMNEMARPLSWASYVGGVIAWALGTAFTFGLVGWLYNRLLQSSKR